MQKLKQLGNVNAKSITLRVFPSTVAVNNTVVTASHAGYGDKYDITKVGTYNIPTEYIGLIYALNIQFYCEARNTIGSDYINFEIKGYNKNDECVYTTNRRWNSMDHGIRCNSIQFIDGVPQEDPVVKIEITLHITASWGANMSSSMNSNATVVSLVLENKVAGTGEGGGEVLTASKAISDGKVSELIGAYVNYSGGGHNSWRIFNITNDTIMLIMHGTTANNLADIANTYGASSPYLAFLRNNGFSYWSDTYADGVYAISAHGSPTLAEYSVAPRNRGVGFEGIPFLLAETRCL